MFHDTAPTVADQFGDSFVTTHGLPDDFVAEMDAAFGYGSSDDDLADEELDLIFEADQARRHDEALTAMLDPNPFVVVA
jgi:hypothetical protein